MPTAIPNQPLQNQALALRDIHLPDPVSWWPPAAGWWILISIAILGFVFIIVWRKIQQKKRIKKAALAEFENIRTAYQNDINPALLARSLSTLLRRICLSYYPHTNVPGMTGKQWLSYLDDTAEVKGFQTGSGKILATAPYLPQRKCSFYDTDTLLSLCESWIQAQPKKEMQK